MTNIRKENIMGVFNGGIPVEGDVKAILSAFEIKPGVVIPYEDIERLTRTGRHQTRFRTITAALKKRLLRDYQLQAELGDGKLEMLTAERALEKNRGDLHLIGRATGRLSIKVETIDINQLSSEKRAQHDLLKRETGALLDAVKRSEKTLAAPKPTAPANLRIAK
jgi:hypothetical protein